MINTSITIEEKEDYLLIALLKDMESKLRGIQDESHGLVSSLSLVFTNGYGLKVSSGQGTYSDSLTFEVEVPDAPFVQFKEPYASLSTRSGLLKFQDHEQVRGLAIEISNLPDRFELINSSGVTH